MRLLSIWFFEIWSLQVRGGSADSNVSCPSNQSCWSLTWTSHEWSVHQRCRSHGNFPFLCTRRFCWLYLTLCSVGGKFFLSSGTYYFICTGMPDVLANGPFPSVLRMGKANTAFCLHRQTDQCLLSNCSIKHPADVAAEAMDSGNRVLSLTDSEPFSCGQA